MTDTVIGAALITLAALICAAPWVGEWSKRKVDEMVAAALDEQADDWGEPSRAQIEVDWTFGGRLPAPDASDEEFLAFGLAAGIIPADPTPLFTAVSAQLLREELEDPEAVAAWLRKDGAA